MKIYFKQTMAKLVFSGKTFTALFAGFLFLCLSSSLCYAPTKMSESELSEIDAQAFFKIEHFSSGDNFWTTPSVLTSSNSSSTYPSFQHYNTGSDNVIRISLDMEVQASAYMQSFKLGYRNGAQGGMSTTTGFGWDIDFTDFWFGNRSATGDGAPLVMNGVIMDFGFNNMGDNATRTLNYIEIGSLHVTGNVTQTLNRVNGLVMHGGTGQNNGVMLRQTASGTRAVNFNDHVMSFVFASKYHYSDQDGTGTDIQGTFLKLPSYNPTDDSHRPGDAPDW